MDFSIAIDTNGDSVPNCGTVAAQVGKCSIEKNTPFRLQIFLNSFAGFVNDDYGGFDLLVAYSGVESLHTPDANVWPDCFSEAYNTVLPGLEALGCAVEPPNDVESTYVGLIGTMDFTCTNSGSLSLLHGIGNTALVDADDIVAHHESENGSETLTINCVDTPVGAIAVDVEHGRWSIGWRLTTLLAIGLLTASVVSLMRRSLFQP